MTLKELQDIALCAVKGSAPENYTMQDVNSAFVDGLRELAGDYNQFKKNQWDIYTIMINAIDEVMPKRVIDALSSFAEVRQIGQGEKLMFRRKLGRNRAKKFLTQVGLSGVYETFRLDSEEFEVSAHAVGGGATIDFERMLDNAEDLAECVQIITDGLVDAALIEVHKALIAAKNQMGPNNKYAGAWNADEMVKLLNVVRAYGSPVIFACPEFVADMGPDAIVPAISGVAQGIYSPKDIEDIHNYGFIKSFRGAPIVEIPQSFVDENNDKTWINPRFAFIMPSGAEKVVKLVLEGQTQIRPFENRDNSMEVYAWKKMGCAILTYNNWCIFEDESLTDTSDHPYGI